MIDLLCLTLYPALLWDSDRWGYWYLLPVALFAWVVDIMLAHTLWPLIAGWPRRNEITISDTLERLCMDFTHPHHRLFVAIAKTINHLDPKRSHIKAVL